MAAADRLRALLPPGAAALVEARKDALCQVRLRAGRPVQACYRDGSDALSREELDPRDLARTLADLMEYSVYARQDDLDSGFFTLDDGSRVGVCGRMYREGERLRLAEIGSACVRLSRQLPGCADPLMDAIDGPGGLRSALVISPPGLGKTTLLRDIARQLSLRGRAVGLADERHELAACHRGVPTLDVGPRTDVLDGCPRDAAIGRLVRTMAPDVVIADEIGAAGDAVALADAARCGVTVMASAHAGGLDDLRSRPCLRAALEGGAFEIVALLGPRPGDVQYLWRRNRGEGDSAWRRE